MLENILKFLVFQLTINVTAGFMTFIMACVLAGQKPKEGETVHKPEFPLSAVQLLWINLLMDSLAALMLATEPPDAELMKMSPADKTRGLLSLTMVKHILVHSVYQLILLLVLALTPAGTSLFNVTGKFGGREHYTCIFNTFIFLQLFNLFNCRRVHDQHDIFRGFHRSVLGVSVLTIIVLLQIVLIEVGGDAFQTMPISGPQWGVSIAVGATSLPVGLIARLIPIRSAFDSARGSSRVSCAPGGGPDDGDAALLHDGAVVVRHVAKLEGGAAGSV